MEGYLQPEPTEVIHTSVMNPKWLAFLMYTIHTFCGYDQTEEVKTGLSRKKSMAAKSVLMPLMTCHPCDTYYENKSG